MEWGVAILLAAVLVIGLLILGNWIAFALAAAGLIIILIDSGLRGFEAVDSIIWNTANNFTLTAIPLFLLLAEIVTVSGVGARFFRGVATLMSPLRGSLLYSTVSAGAVFSAVSGSSIAGVAAIGRVALPEMQRRKYDDRLNFASLAGVGGLGQLIPPSIGLILYGAVVSESVSKLFLAALVPGLILTAMFLLYIMVSVLLKPSRAPRPRESGETHGDNFGKSLANTVPLLLLIALIMAAMYAGWATPTEAAALGAAAAVIAAKLLGKFGWTEFVDSLRRTVKTTVMLLFIMIGAQVLSYALSSTGVTRSVVALLSDADLDPTVMLILLVVFFMILGMFIDGTSMMLLTLPTLWPALAALGFDPIVFGVIMMVLVELGLITPPVGLSLFVLKSIDRRASIATIAKAALPIVAMMLVLVFLVWFFPGLALWVNG